MADRTGPGRSDKLALARAKDLRARMSLPEAILWERLRARRLEGLKFRRQTPMLEYILDFYCAERRLCIEIDGDAHIADEQAAHDRRRDERLGGINILTLRFSARQVLEGEEPTEVLDAIVSAARTRPPLAR